MNDEVPDLGPCRHSTVGTGVRTQRNGPGRNPRRLMLTALCLAVLIAQIDTSVVNLAVRPIGAYFRADIAALQWVVDAYNLVYAVLLLTGGLLADLFGRKLAFMVGAGIFTAASLLCAFAPDISVLIGGRAIAGLGAALLLPASLAIIRVAWPDAVERGRVLGVWASCNGLAFVIGPSIGGLMIDNLGWRSIFILVVPLGAAALALAAGVVAETSDPKERRFDAAAQVFGAAALGSLALAAIEVDAAPFLARGAFVVAVVALLLFIRVERRAGTAALVPLGMFRVPAFSGAVAATAAMTFGMYGVLFLLPLTWQSAGMLSPVGVGIALMPMALIFVVVSPFSGVLAEKLGARLMISGGVAIIGGGLLVLAATAGWMSIAGAEAGLALTGVGMGIATGPLFGLAVANVSAARSGTAGALINVARMAGATIGVAVLGAAFAVAHGGAAGLRVAMLCGGLVQLMCAGIAWRVVQAKR
jgi:MFS transporter, DHA2 family, methylenomycin A resistance protein